MLCQSFPERLGHCICYMSPAVFFYVFETVKFLIDKRTREKIIFLTGDMTDGSANDIKMKTVLGDNWKELTGAMKPVITKGHSPGFNFETYWSSHMKKIESTTKIEIESETESETWKDSHDNSQKDLHHDLQKSSKYDNFTQIQSKKLNRSNVSLYTILAVGLFFVIYSLKVSNKMVSIVSGLLGISFFYGILVLYPNSIDALIAYESNDKKE